MRKLISTILVIFSIFSCFTFGASAAKAKSIEIKTVNDAMKIAAESDGFSIKKAVWYKEGKKQGTIYVLGLSGTSGTFNPVKVNNIYNCFLSDFSIPNSYTIGAIKYVTDNVPEGSKLFVVGHSLGGMVAQQVSSSITLRTKYDIIGVLAIGSPYVLNIGSGSTFNRVVDSGDAIAFISPVFFANFFAGHMNYQNTGNFGKPNTAHNDSYLSSEVWDSYDCFGFEGNSNKLVIK